MKKCIRNGKVAVLYSPGYGAGWSTWNRDHAEFLTFDAGLVKLAESEATGEAVERYIVKKLGDVYVCLGGWSDISIKWLDQGSEFYIHEYDGSESIKYRDSDEWMKA